MITDDEAKALAEEFAILKDHAKRHDVVEKALKEYIKDGDPIEIYHDGKMMILDFHPPKTKHPAGDLRNSWTVKKGVNMKLFQTIINHGALKGIGAGAAWGCFKAIKKEVEKAIDQINDPAFNADLAKLVNFDTAPRFGFRVAGKDEEETDVPAQDSSGN